jgi:dienelactone hydrolase
MTSDLGRRTDVRIPAGRGEEVDAWMYLPDGPGPYPVVVMAHGIGGVKAAGLAPFAERFAASGFAAMVFDYRHWGRLGPAETAAVDPPSVGRLPNGAGVDARAGGFR